VREKNERFSTGEELSYLLYDGYTRHEFYMDMANESKNGNEVRIFRYTFSGTKYKIRRHTAIDYPLIKIGSSTLTYSNCGVSQRQCSKIYEFSTFFQNKLRFY
jgi:hypothetical protein